MHVKITVILSATLTSTGVIAH